MALKVKAKGGKGGNEWDDGSDYHYVTKIHVRGGCEGIQFVKFEYVKDGQNVVGPIHGVSGPGFTQLFEINHLQKEYLLSVEGYYDESSGVIQSLQFKTNMKTSDVMGYNEGTKFSLDVAGKKIIGFHGFAGKSLNSLGAYFTKGPSTKSAIQGGQTTGKNFDDGGENDGIRKVYVNHDGTAIRYVKFVYDKAGNEVIGARGGNEAIGERGETIGTQYEFTVNYPYEHVTSVEGSYAVTQPYGCTVLRSLTFKTSSGRTSQVIGTVTGTRFVLESKGNIIVGFHGRVGSCVDGIGAYYSPLPPQETDSPLKVEAKGGKGGNKWDDGYNYNGLTKIHVRGGFEGIQFIKIEYVKDGKTIDGPVHGVSGRGMTETFEVNHLGKEYLISVEGYYDESTGVIQSIIFKTNMKTSDIIGYNDQGTKFSLSASGKKIIGFHGFAGKNLNSLGAYFVRIPSTKSTIQGGKTTGKSFDDGGDFDGVKKVYVNHDGTALRYVKFVYDKDGNEVIRARGGNEAIGERGEKIGTQYEFTVNYPYEHITSVEGSYALTQPYGCIVLRSITFKTSSGRNSQIGAVTGTTFVLESKGDAIIGFHGRVGSCVDGIGVYYSPLPLPPSPSSEKLQGKGGDGGDSWDDGVFKNVKKIYVGQGHVGVASLKFEYEDETSGVVVGKEHGKKTLLDYEEFELDYPTEYITSIEGCYDKVVGAESGIITMLRFKTNKRTSPNFGLESEFSFVLQKEGHKIVGFHGKASTFIHQIGVHVAPIT